MAVSIGFAVDQEVRGGGFPQASGPEPLGPGLALSFLDLIPVLHFAVFVTCLSQD